MCSVIRNLPKYFAPRAPELWGGAESYGSSEQAKYADDRLTSPAAFLLMVPTMLGIPVRLSIVCNRAGGRWSG